MGTSCPPVRSPSTKCSARVLKRFNIVSVGPIAGEAPAEYHLNLEFHAEFYASFAEVLSPDAEGDVHFSRACDGRYACHGSRTCEDLSAWQLADPIFLRGKGHGRKDFLRWIRNRGLA